MTNKESKEKYLIVVAGSTASGKTGVAIQLAQHFNTEIISADSRQFYKEMSIGTAKQTAEELAAVPHHFVNSLSIFDAPYSVGDFEREVIALLEEQFKEKDCLIICGGSGLFIQAVLEGLDEFPEVPEQVKTQIENTFEQEGIEYLQNQIKSKDPEYFKKVDTQNPRRLMRALSVIEASGKTYSSFLHQKKRVRPFKSIFIQLDWERSILYERINKRVDLMIEAGLVNEAKALHTHRQIKALNTVGYQELFDYFDGKTDLAKAIELIKRNSRRYAKRQMTWLRKVENKALFHPKEYNRIINYITEKINLKKTVT